MEPREVVERLFRAIETADVEALAALYADDALQIEYPNRLLPAGARRTKPEILAAAERGRALMAAQTLEIERAVVDGETVAVEARWSARLAIDAPPLGLRAGATMTARFAQFVVVRHGRVVHHTTYDCFDPWDGVAPRA